METTNIITITWLLKLEKLVDSYVAKYEPERWQRTLPSILTEDFFDDYYNDEYEGYEGTMEDYLEEHRAVLEKYYSEFSK